MINKSKIWFLTLISVILVLAVYYIGFPENESSLVFKSTSNSDIKTDISESEVITAMKVNKDEARENEIATLQEELLDTNKNANEKNEVYEKIQLLNTNNSIEEKIEKLINEEYKIKSFVEIKDTNLKVTLVNSKSSYEFANKIINLANNATNNDYYVSVRFQ